jgi:putative Ca2+/H+ antiporter (TMEM165/GDT1 family)
MVLLNNFSRCKLDKKSRSSLPIHAFEMIYFVDTIMPELYNTRSSLKMQSLENQKSPNNEPIENLEEQNVQQKQWNFWAIFTSTFLTIFLAEMGDKTQLVTLLISAESKSPWIVFAGAVVALISTSLLGVLIGYWLSKRLSPKTLDFAVAILLLIISGLLIGDIIF